MRISYAYHYNITAGDNMVSVTVHNKHYTKHKYNTAYRILCMTVDPICYQSVNTF